MSEDNETWTMFLFKFRRKTKGNVCLLLKILFGIFVTYVILNTLRVRNSLYYTNIHKEQLIIGHKNYNYIRKLSEQLQKDKESLTDCPIPRLKKQHIPKSYLLENKTKVPSCHRVKPLARSCDLTKALFLDKSKGTCSHQEPVQICHFKGKSRDLVCDSSNCRGLRLGYRDSETGELSWSQARSTKELTAKIVRLLKSAHNGFCYMQSKYSDNFENVQLLVLPPTFKTKHDVKLSTPFINVNLIFIDSVSRHHFFRSLPETVKFFEEVNSGNEAVVLDFELLQAMRSRTFETLDSLFGGYVPQTDKMFGRFQMPPEPLKVHGLFRLFENTGYETLWMEDLCFEWEWGIPKDLLVHNKSLTTAETWDKLKKAFNIAGIGSFGMSPANCDILSHNGVNDHFHGPDTVCFNGRHQHDYMLEYLQLYQEKMSSFSRPYLTFLETNVGHEDKGTRIQTLDKELEKYLRFAVKEENTLTILFSDHGNAYGEYIDESQEARVEMFQPAMFVIVPGAIANQLGTDKMEALTLNQNRLISHLDLHYTIKSLVSKISHIPNINKQYQVTPDGLFRNISLERGCSSVPQIPPNFCICVGGESRLENNSANVLYAHFAVGRMNNDIQSQFREASRHAVTSFGRCIRLELAAFQHVRRAVNLDKSISMTMDLLFKTRDPGFHGYEVFVVTVQSEPDGKDMQLVKFDRLTPYSKYSVCVDQGVHLQLCICDITNHKIPKHIPLSISKTLTKSDILMKANVASIEQSRDCLLRINQENRQGLTMSLTNVCPYVLVHVTLDVHVVNLVLSEEPPFQLSLKPGETQFLFVGFATDESWDCSLEFKFSLTTWP